MRCSPSRQLPPLLIGNAVNSVDRDQVTRHHVHDPVLAHAQTVVSAPVERLQRIGIIGQGGDGYTDGTHAFLVVQVTAR